MQDRDFEGELPDEERADEERPAIEELVGESEHSVQEAAIDERGSSRRGTPRDEEIHVDPDDLGRHALEEATELGHRKAAGGEPLRGPLR
jgi:hypothetical protein